MGSMNINRMHNFMNAANTAIVRVLSGLLILMLALLLVLSIRITGLVRVVLMIGANMMHERFAVHGRRIIAT